MLANNAFKFFLIFLIIACVSIGQALFKYVSILIGQENPLFGVKVLGFTILSFVISGFGSLIYIGLLKHMTLSAAYPFMALSFVAVPLLGVLLYQDRLTAPYFLGIALIILGIIVVTRNG